MWWRLSLLRCSTGTTALCWILCTWPAHVSINSWIHCASSGTLEPDVMCKCTGKYTQLQAWIVYWVRRQTNAHAVHGGRRRHHASVKMFASLSTTIINLFSPYAKPNSFLSPSHRRRSLVEASKNWRKKKNRKTRKRVAGTHFFLFTHLSLRWNWIDENHVACIGYFRRMQMKGDSRYVNLLLFIIVRPNVAQTS